MENNTIYDLLNFEIFNESKYFIYSILISIFFFAISLNLKKKVYQKNFISFLKDDVVCFILANIFTFSIFFVFVVNFKIDLHTIYLIVYLLTILGISKLYFNNLYQNLINKNIIQKNIMLVGTYDELKIILKEKFEKIFVFKCCLITDFKNHDKKYLRSEFKFPIFNEDESYSKLQCNGCM